MAELTIHTKRIRENINALNSYFAERNIQWSLITKVFSGDQDLLAAILTQDTIEGINSVGDSRLSSLKKLKEFNPELRTIYIKPPAEIYAHEVVKYADISLNSSLSTIDALNAAAEKHRKKHKIIIMVELGELREGVNREDIIALYQRVFELSNIEVIGIGSNLGCMYGVAPTYDKLLHLTLYKDLIEAKFGHKLDYISGGTSITLPLVDEHEIPSQINHFRVGEAAFFGRSPLKDGQFKDLNTNTFEFAANIIELEEKGLIPGGEISDSGIGETVVFDKSDRSRTTFKAILDFGLLDVDQKDLHCEDPNIRFVGVTSDMMVVDLGENRDVHGNPKYKIGDTILFQPNYMAVARLLNSKFIAKHFVS